MYVEYIRICIEINEQNNTFKLEYKIEKKNITISYTIIWFFFRKTF